MSNRHYNARYLPVINRQLYPAEPTNPTAPPDWYSDFLTSLKRNSTNASIYDEISAILNNTKSKFSSVDEVVQDLKERTGLSQLLNSRQIIAAIQEPEIFQVIPELKVFIDNFVQDRPGTSIASVVNDALKIDSIRNKLPNKNDVDDDVKAYINHRIADSSMQISDTNKIDMNLGKVEHSNEIAIDDPLKICEPNRSK